MKKTAKTETNFAYKSLGAVRKKLLDLSGRNSLLNYKHRKTNSIRLIDESPDQIMQELQSGKTFTFIPVPEPTERELEKAGFIAVDPQTEKTNPSQRPDAEKWAKYLGLSTSFELPNIEAENSKKKHQDANLQTLLYPSQLEARLRKILSLSETAIQESGANILYLALGYLQWYEEDNSETPRIAPLFTLPVRLERAKYNKSKGIFPYSITLKDDGLVSNITLSKKLQNDFALELPTVNEDLPEKYFEKVKEVILHNKPHWKILRQASLVLLNFVKQAMYTDLNPDNWPSEASIENHPNIKQFFSSNGQATDAEPLGFAPEYPIDRIANIHDQFPLIYEADSSQHSAIIDALKGKNIAIEGPPGTGKSQTITNLIAACLANGKKVLFVAEKMAALNVVKHRLDLSGLGDFCLELHSHKTHKKRILQDLGDQLLKVGLRIYTSPSSIDVNIGRYEALKQKLHDYVELINSKWKQSNLTLHDILNKATRYREQLPHIKPVKLAITGINGENLTPAKQLELLDQVKMLGDIYDQILEQTEHGVIAGHYWYGVGDGEMMGDQLEALKQHLRRWNKDLKELSIYWKQLDKEFDLTNENNTTLKTIQEVSDALSNLPETVGDEFFEQLPKIVQKEDAFDKFLTDHGNINQELENLKNTFNSTSFNTMGSSLEIKSALEKVRELGCTEDYCLREMARDCQAIGHTRNKWQDLKPEYRQINEKLPVDLKNAFSLSINGLKEFNTFLNLIEQLPANLWSHRDKMFDNSDLDALITQLTDELRTLLPLHKLVLDQFRLYHRLSVQELKQHHSTIIAGGPFRHFSAKWRRSKKAILELSANPKPDIKVLALLLPQLIEYVEGKERIKQINEGNQTLGSHYKGVETPIERITALRTWYKTVRAEYGTFIGERVDIGNALLVLDRNLAREISEVAKRSLQSQVVEVLQEVDGYRHQFAQFQLLNKPGSNLSSSGSPLSELYNEVKSSLDILKKHVSDEQFNISSLTVASEQLESTQKKIEQWRKSEFRHCLVPKLPSPSTVAKEFSPQVTETCKRTARIAKIIASSPCLLNSINTKSSESRYRNLRAVSPQLKTLTRAANQAESTFISQGSVNISEWKESSNNAIDLLIDRNRRALDKPGWLNNWLDYIRTRNKISEQGLGNIINGLEANSFKTKDLDSILQLVLYHKLAKEVLAKNKSLKDFSGMEQMANSKRFKDYDKKILVLQRQKIAFRASNAHPPIGNAAGKVSNYTEASLIMHEVGKKTRHIAVRSLVERAGAAIQSLKPCFMMSPMSVAQYLKPGQFTFDIVVMDEASQIRPEDALGSLARGSSVVIVGDPKQLPPTNFFQIISNDDDNEDAVALEESESILDAVIPMFKKRRLRWHYRSRHESLINFSNQHFYDSNLILFPSPYRDPKEFGIRFERVEKGRFVNRRNTEEALAVVKDAMQQLIDKPHESVGIVAMNSQQREEIEKLLDGQIKDDQQFRKAYEENLGLEDPLFIKNLENVQGDERDVVIISMTYGPEQIGGRTYQRFGPINRDDGWRRLNVLFTRSKKRMHIFSSMESADVLTDTTRKKGVQSLRAFLEYCETGHLHNIKHTKKAPDSDFEVAVMKKLSAHGYECEPQLGVSGYFLDLAVIDPEKPGRYLMGIECDGATYHSAKSTRDRDRLRQDNLESLGWKIHRIWSPDWFRNPQAQIERILPKLEKLKKE